MLFEASCSAGKMGLKIDGCSLSALTRYSDTLVFKINVQELFFLFFEDILSKYIGHANWAL